VATTYDAFTDRLNKSRPAMFRVAEWIHRKGRSVYIPAIIAAPKGSDWKDYVDDGDLFVDDDVKGRLKVEVKHVNIDFTGPKNWPYPSVIVSGKGTIERNMGTVETYIIVNKQMTHAMIVLGETTKHWYIKRMFAKNTQKEEDFYLCPMEHVIFTKIVE